MCERLASAIFEIVWTQGAPKEEKSDKFDYSLLITKRWWNALVKMILVFLRTGSYSYSMEVLVEKTSK